MNGNVRVEEHNFCFSVKKERQREYCFVEEECRSQFGKELTGTNFAGGVLNINILPGTVLLLVSTA